MKKSLVILLSAALSSQAALVYFDISPAGSGAAVGLSPSNMVPPVVNSSGSGGSISAGVVFDTDTSLLHLAIGYGLAAGFTDLTGPATVISINGPTTAGGAMPPLFVLTPYNFPALDPARGGVIYGSVAYPTNAVGDPVSNLLAGLHYVVIGTPTNPAGEIRGQSIPTPPPNAAPVVSCPDAATLECGTQATVTVVVSDPEGDALTVLWTVNGMTVQTNKVLASDPPAAANVSFAAKLPLGTNIVGVAVTDSATNTAACSTLITVVDTTPPVIHTVSAKPNVLWPPNHKMINVAVNARVTDSCSLATWKIIEVRSSEPENGLGDGDTAPDWQIIDNHSLELRAERSGQGTDRIYTITIQAEDSSGNLSEPKPVTVTVPKSQGKNSKDGDKSQGKRS